MGRSNTPILDEATKAYLETGYKKGLTPSFCIRCHIILLKSENRNSTEVARILNITETTVNSWTNKFNKSGIKGLESKEGRGRKPLLDKKKDAEAVLSAVKEYRQRVATAKAEFEEQGGQKTSHKTFVRFLKALTEDISE